MGYKAYPEYKESGVEWLGKVPSHWRVERLRFSVQTNPSKSEIKHLDESLQVSFVPMDAVGELGGLRLDSEKEISEVSNGYSYFADGDVLIAKITPCFENGKGAIAKNLKNGAGFGTTEFHVLRCEKNLNRDFLFYLSISHSFREIGASQMLGAGGQKRVTDEFIRDFRIVLPSLLEQKKIATFLNYKTAQIDRLIEKKQELIEKLQEQRIAIITLAVTKGLNVHALAGTCTQEWLGNIPDHWKRNQKLNYLSTDDRNSFVNGPFGSDLLTTELVDEGVPVIYSGDVKETGFQRKSNKYVTEEKAKQLDFCRVDGGDILLAKVGDPPGDACVYPLDQPSGIVTQDVVRIKVDKRTAYPEYLCFLLNSEYGRHLVRLVSVEATRGRFSLADLKSIRHILPPLEEQQEIALHIQQQMKRCNRLRDLAIREIEALQEYRIALITAAVTGQIDVRDWQAPEPFEPSAQDKDVA